MMVEYMAQPGGVLDGVTDFEEVMRPYWDAVSANSQEQREAMTSQAPTQVFLATMRELLMSGKSVVLDMGIANQPTTPPIGMIGYRDAEKYYFIPGAAYGAVCESLRVLYFMSTALLSTFCGLFCQRSALHILFPPVRAVSATQPAEAFWSSLPALSL